MLVVWLTAIFFFVLAWKATAIYCVKYQHVLRSAAIALLLVPIGVADLAFPGGVGLLIYSWDGMRKDMMWAVVGSLKVLGTAGLVSWIAFKVNAWKNKFDEKHADENPHTNRKHSRRA